MIELYVVESSYAIIVKVVNSLGVLKKLCSVVKPFHYM